MKRLTTTIIGIVLLVISIGAIAFVGSIMNPKGTDVFVALEDIPPGEMIQPYMVALVSAQLDNASMYLNTGNIDQFASGVIVGQIYAGEMIPLSSIADPDSPVLDSRISLALDDPNMVALVVPVDPETSPQDIVVGDYVDLILAVGSGTFLSGNFDTVSAPEGANDYYFQSYGYSTEDGGESTDPFTYEELFYEGGQINVQGPTPTPVVNPITLPVAKTVALRTEVLSVQHEIIVNSAFNPDVDAPMVSKGDILGIVVTVPREMEEIVAFGVANGDLRIAVLSPLTGEDAIDRTPGMSWDDLVAFFKWEREEWVDAEDHTDIEIAPGSSYIYPTLIAPQENSAASMPVQAESTPAPTATPSP